MDPTLDLGKKNLADHVARLAGKKVLVVGDVILDRYVFGKVSRISPEAPVPVVEADDEKYTLGGAGNVAMNIAGLGGDCTLVGVSGRDSGADILNRLFDQNGFTAHILADPERPTTEKTRIIAHNQQVVRVDREYTRPLSKNVLAELVSRLEGLIKDHEVVVVSDYGKGIVSKGFVEGLKRAAGERKVLVDPKLKNFALYKDVFIITPNTKEAVEGAGLYAAESNGDILRAGINIFKKLKNRHLLITLGPKGMAVFESPGKVWHISTTAKNVYDVTGAGDTVIAVTALALASGLDLVSSCVLANYAAGIVVGRIGTSAVKPDELQAAIKDLPPPVLEKWLSQG